MWVLSIIYLEYSYVYYTLYTQSINVYIIYYIPRLLMKSTEAPLVTHIQLRAFLDLNKIPHGSKSATKICSTPTDGDGFWALSLHAGQDF